MWLSIYVYITGIQQCKVLLIIHTQVSHQRIIVRTISPRTLFVYHSYLNTAYYSLTVQASHCLVY